MNSSYPFEPGPVLVKNAWYVVAWSSDVTRDPIGRTVLGQPIVLYRTETGTPVALADRCPHRGFSLAKSRLAGDAIACGYHGFRFDPDGRCIHVPSQEYVPSGFRTRGYPVAERWKWIWIWMGSPAEADESLIPDHDHAGLTTADWLAEVGYDFLVNSRYQLFNENLLDLTHLAFLHPGTIGTPGMATSKTRTEVEGRVVRVLRDTRDEEAPAPYAKRLGIPVGRIDRHHVTTFIAPAFHIIHVTITQAASTANGTPPAVHGEHKTVHALTPETATSFRDFWAFSRTYNRSAEITEYLRGTISDVIRQDIDALEAVENLLGESTNIVDIHCAADESSLKGRRVVQSLLREQVLVSGGHANPA